MATADWPLPERFTFQGHSIAWGVLGKGSPAILLHGTPFSSWEWRRIGPLLAEQRRIYCFDMLGYGRSDKPDGDVSRGIQNELFAALYDHWDLRDPDVVAHDFGGSTALRGHLLNGLNYRSLVLIDPVAISPQGSPLVKAAKKYEEVFSSLPSYIHEAMLRAYIGGAVANALRGRDGALPCTVAGGRRPKSLLASGRPRWTTNTRKKSNGGTVRFVARSPSYGGRKTSGFP